MIELTKGGEGETYEEIADMIAAELGSRALPGVVELKFTHAGDAGNFLANPTHLFVLNLLLADRVPPSQITRAMFAPGGSMTDVTIALELGAV